MGEERGPTVLGERLETLEGHPGPPAAPGAGAGPSARLPRLLHPHWLPGQGSVTP